MHKLHRIKANIRGWGMQLGIRNEYIFRKIGFYQGIQHDQIYVLVPFLCMILFPNSQTIQ